MTGERPPLFDQNAFEEAQRERLQDLGVANGYEATVRLGTGEITLPGAMGRQILRRPSDEAQGTTVDSTTSSRRARRPLDRDSANDPEYNVYPTKEESERPVPEEVQDLIRQMHLEEYERRIARDIENHISPVQAKIRADNWLHRHRDSQRSA